MIRDPQYVSMRKVRKEEDKLMSYGCLPYSNLTTTNSKSRKVERGGVTTTENRMLVADGGTRGLGVRSQHRIAMLVAKA